MDTILDTPSVSPHDLKLALGFTTEFRAIQNWLTARRGIKQVFVVSRPSPCNIIQVIAYIELNSVLSKSEKQQYAEYLNKEISQDFDNFLLPTKFVFVDVPDTQYSNSGFKENVLQQKFNSCDIFDTRYNYWSSTLTKLPHLHNLPIDKSRQVNHSSSRSHLTRTIQPHLYKELERVCSELGVELFVFLQTAFAILVARYSNDSDIIMGAKYTEVSYLNAQEKTNVGFDNLVLRNHISENVPFLEQLKINRSIVRNSYANNAPYEEILTQVQTQESLVQQLFQVKIDFQKLLSNEIELLNSWLNGIYDENKRFKYDLELCITCTEQNLFINWFYNANLFNKDSINRLAESFCLLVSDVVKSIETPVYSLSLLTEKEKKKLLESWNETESANEQILIQEAIDKQVAMAPDKIAVVYDDKCLTYRALYHSSQVAADKLKKAGVQSGSIVAVCIADSISLVSWILGILRVGAAYLPLDPDFPKKHLDYIIEDSKVNFLVSGVGELLEVDKVGLKTFFVDEENIENYDRGRAFTTAKAASVQDESVVAYVMYTSGSTKQPKGVLGTHRSVMNRVSWMKRSYKVNSSDVFCLKTSICSVDHVSEIFQPLTSGASLVILNTSLANEANRLAKLIYKHKVTRLTLLPSMLKKLIEDSSLSEMSSLKYITSSGEPLHNYLVDEFYKKFGISKVLLNLYGSTETGADVSCYEVDFKSDFDVLSYFSKESSSGAGKTQLNSIISNLETPLANLKDEYFTSPRVDLKELKQRFMNTLIPTKPIALDDYLENLKQDVFPFAINVAYEKYIGHMTSPLPNFIPAFNHLLTKINQNVVKVETAKSFTLIERQVLAMLHRIFYGFDSAYYEEYVQNPKAMFGVVTSGGSVANITALYCARNSSLLKQGATEKELLELGSAKVMKNLGYEESVILVSRLAHYSIKKAASLLGIGLDNLLMIEQDEEQKVDVSALESLIHNCHKNKQHIIAIIGIAGATETGTIDPLDEMANIAEKHKIHFHVDAAWGGAFIFSKKYRHKLSGIERANSITICAHKQLYIAQGMSVCLFKDSANIFSVTTHAEYQSQKGSLDLGQFTIEGSRPALSILLHASLHLFSTKGYEQIIEQSMEKTSFLRNVLEESDCFQLVGENDLNIINYRYIPKSLRCIHGNYSETDNRLMNKINEKIQQLQFFEGKSFVSKTKILYRPISKQGISVFRIVLANPNTSYEDILDVLRDQVRIASKHVENEETMLHEENLRTLSSVGSDMHTVPIGNPIDNVEFYILDKYLNPVPIGVAGELYISGACLANGYLNQEKLNLNSFIRNPFKKSNQLMFKTGDLVRRLSNGDIEYMGRIDLQVKLKGHRVKLHEIKTQLDKLKCVGSSVVLVENNLFTETSLVAYVELSKKESLSVDSGKESEELIREKLRISLPEFMVPARIKVLKKLPLTPNGKVNFKEL